LLHAPTTNVFAERNLFSVNPITVVFSDSTGTIDVANSLVGPPAFVQALYLDVLGRIGTVGEINAWASALPTMGQTGVADAILHSPEALGRIIDSFYLRFLGRQSDAGGRAGWISFLQNGGTEEQVESRFLSSTEYISHINVDFV